MLIRNYKFHSLLLLMMVPLTLCAPPSSAGEEPKHTIHPPNGYVPDKMTALRIAEAVLVPIYGQKRINKEKPLVVTLNKGVWIVTGTAHNIVAGGVAVVEISKKDARILRMSHGK